MCTHGPMFRRERPQKGRYRQFHQINIEAIGEKNAYIDFEIILVAKLLLDLLRVNSSDYRLIVNSLGSTEDQTNYSKILKNYFESSKSKLSETSLERLEKNPLRILDSKNEEDQKLITNAPSMKEVLSEKSKHYFEQIKELLTENGIDFIEDNKLVRGLDYYTHTAFEFQTTQDKRQNAILAGGRYDRLINMISSKDLPGIGWAAGVERLMDLISLPNKTLHSQLKILIAVQDDSFLKNKLIMNQFYNSSYTHEVKASNNIKKLFTYADKNNFNYIVLIGQEENQNQKITIKNLMSKEQKSINQSEFNLANEVR
jgi:histidyl-tRNA synthetase